MEVYKCIMVSLYYAFFLFLSSPFCSALCLCNYVFFIFLFFLSHMHACILFCLCVCKFNKKKLQKKIVLCKCVVM